MRLINSILNSHHEKVQIVVIDDASSETYKEVEKLSKGNPDIIYVKNKCSLHKFKSIYKNRGLYRGEYLTLLDDKDILIPNWYALISPALVNEGVVIISDMVNKNKKIIGFPFKGKTFAEFHFIQAKYGDKFLVFPTKLFRDFNIDLEKYGSEKIYNLDLFMNEVFDLPVIYINTPLVIHEYLPSGISANNIQHKIANPISRKDIIQIKMGHKSCLKYKIYKCYEVWLIRNKVRFEFPTNQYRLLYWVLLLSFAFPILNRYFKSKIKGLVG